MKQQSFIDITPKNGWIFSATSFLVEDLPDGKSDLKNIGRRKTVLCASTTAPGTYALEAAVKSASQDATNNTGYVEVFPFPNTFLRGTHRQLLGHGKRYIDRLLNYAASTDKSLLIGFLIWGSTQSLDIFPLLRYVREASEGTAVAAVGGPLFSRRLPEIEADLTAAGADIFNIGGGKEFSTFVSGLTPQDRFLRDDDGYLHLSLPPQAPFFTPVCGQDTTFIGNKVYIPPTPRWKASALDVSPPGIGCAGNCGFCGAAKHVRSHDASLFPLIPQLAQETQALIEKYHPDQNQNFQLFQIRVDSPNPFERIDALNAFFDALDLSKVSGATPGFGEASAFILPSGVDKHLAFFDKLLGKYPHLISGLTISLDATHYEDDNEFLHKTVGNHVLQEHELAAINRNYLRFLEETDERAWVDRFSIETNIIYHPAMTPEAYFKKGEVLNNIHEARTTETGNTRFILRPYPASQHARTWKGHFAPVHHMAKEWALGHSLANDDLSCWGNQFKHGDLLDCFTLYRLLYAKYDAKLFSYRKNLLPVIWDDRQAEYLQKGYINDYDIEAGRKVFMEIDNESRYLFDTKGPRIIPALDEIVRTALETSEHEKSIGHVRSLFDVYGLVKWFHVREKYLMEHNPLYANNKNCRAIVDATADMLAKFSNVEPLFKKVDERPRPRTPRLRSTPFRAM